MGDLRISRMRFQIVEHRPGLWHIYSAPNGTYQLCGFGGGKFEWRPGSTGFIPYPFDTRAQAEAKARELADKPKMTPEERKARMIACGWED